jgi:hypothetical protein
LADHRRRHDDWHGNQGRQWLHQVSDEVMIACVPPMTGIPVHQVVTDPFDDAVDGGLMSTTASRDVACQPRDCGNADHDARQHRKRGRRTRRSERARGARRS